MKFLIITRDTPANSNVAGHFARVDGLISYLFSRQHDIHVYYPNRLFGRRKNSFYGSRPVSSIWSLFDYDYLSSANILTRFLLAPFKLVRRFKRFSIDESELYLPSIEKTLRKNAKHNDYDIIIVSAPPHSFLTLINPLRLLYPNSNIIADCRDPWTLRPLLYNSNASLKKQEAGLLKKFNSVLVVSSVMRREYAREFDLDNIYVLENGISDWIAKYKIPALKQKNTSEILFGYFGTGGINHSSGSGKDLQFLCEFFEKYRHFKYRIKLLLRGHIINNSLSIYKQTSIAPSCVEEKLVNAYDEIDIAVYIYMASEDVSLVMGAKLYEYLSRDKFIWVITNGRPEAIQEFADNIGGVHITDIHTTDIESDFDYVLSQYENFSGRHDTLINQYKRDSLIDVFFKEYMDDNFSHRSF